MATGWSISTLQRSRRAGAVHNGDLPKLFGAAASVPKGCCPCMHTQGVRGGHRRIEGMQAEAPKHGLRRLARTPLTHLGLCWLGRRSTWCWSMASTGVHLAIYWRLIESDSGSCLIRTMIGCFPTQDDHVTVDTVQARLAPTVKSELCKSSAVADKEKLKIIQRYVRSVCQGMRLEVETALNDAAMRPAIDRFVFFCSWGSRASRRGSPPPRTIADPRLQSTWSMKPSCAVVCQDAQNRARQSAG